MGLDDRLVKDQKKAVKKAAEPDPYYESEPDYMAYINRERPVSLDKYEGVFADKDKKSLNRRPSVFDETAIFKTDSEEF
jgi:hypothetical protein